MRGRTTLEDGLTILQSIAESDAFKEMRERLRDRATRLADNDRVPRLIAGSAGILAALLAGASSEVEPDFTHDSAGFEREREASEPVDDAEDEVPESVATLRDLDDPTLLDDEPPVEEALYPEEPVDEDRLLRFDADDEELEGSKEVPKAPRSTARSETSNDDAKAKGGKGRSTHASASKKPAKKTAAKGNAPSRATKPKAKTAAAKAPAKSAKAATPKAPRSSEPARAPARSSAVPPPKTPRPRAKKSS